ncbi:MAG: SRPBCC family protein [Gemmatimonadetes bacterium]|nr:SRPBCC family protein [Gemmatimonadota bacterium]
MGMRIEESFDVAAPADRVWSFLIDPAQVVACLPGAELTSVEDAHNFQGRIRVKVGPVTASFRGKARFDEIDAAAGRVRMTGDGQDTAGAGTARMRMTSLVEAAGDRAARVVVEAEVDIAGRLAQFGRGMMEEISKQLFHQFAECVRARVEADSSGSADAAPRTAAGGPSPQPGAGTGAAASSSGQASGPGAAEPLRVLPLIWSALRAFFRRLRRG